MNNNNFNQAVKEAKNIIVISHVNPDGDTLSAVLALTLLIKTHYNKDVTPVYTNKIPEIYDFLPQIDLYKNVKDIDPEVKYDLAIAVDVASKERMGEAGQLFEKAKKTINIDHHKTNKGFADIDIIDPAACSAGQVIFDIAESLNLSISKEIAVCFYTSILTDTGCFKYENTSVKTFITASKLVELGANPCEISRACYDSKPQNMVQFQVSVINNAKFDFGGKVAYAIITKDIMDKFNASDDYTDGISEALRQIKTVEASIVLKEVENQFTKVSMRSKTIDVSKIAGIFNGGGHTYAAGCTIKKPPKVAINKLLEYISREIV